MLICYWLCWNVYWISIICRQYGWGWGSLNIKTTMTAMSYDQWFNGITVGSREQIWTLQDVAKLEAIKLKGLAIAMPKCVRDVVNICWQILLYVHAIWYLVRTMYGRYRENIFHFKRGQFIWGNQGFWYTRPIVRESCISGWITQ